MHYLSRILTDADIAAVRTLPEVDAARSQLGSQNNKVYFTADLPNSVKLSILDNAGINLFDLEQVPCRWIQGDTPAHIDRGAHGFEKTFLTYITDSEGEFVLGEDSYPITAGSGFVFSEGLEHKVIGTNGSARLMIGPMSEQGFAVGAGNTIVADGLTDTIYIRQTPSATTLDYQINSNGWTTITATPVSIQNINGDTPKQILKVLFTTNITLTNSSDYFIPITEGIQFGSTSLNSDGTKPTITVDGVSGYNGFIRNGTLIPGDNGQDNIKVYNLHVDTSNGSTLYPEGGWVCQSYFGKAAVANYIVNCSSSGDLTGETGGIVGAFAGSESGAQLYIYGCSSTGIIDQFDGGIVGTRAGNNGGTVTCEQCWSEGVIIGLGAGGIFGDFAGLTSGTIQAIKCYSTGAIVGQGAGGIFGRYAAQAATATAEQCYSRGNIAIDGGGIFGENAAFSFGNTIATNCYSSGIITTSGNGIYGTGKGAGAITTNCYIADGSFSTTAANLQLQGFPINPDLVGTTWVSTGIDQPYELNGMGYTPYTVLIINSATSQLIRTFSQTIQAGQSTVSALNADASGNSFTILQKEDGDEGSYGTITMSAQTGAISTTDATVPGTYTIILRSVGSYNITTFALTVNAVSGGGTAASTTCCPSKGSIGDVSYETRNEFRSGARSVVEHNTNKNMKFPSYREYLYYKMALAKSNP